MAKDESLCIPFEIARIDQTLKYGDINILDVL